jgi:Tol biopolymer transport system component
VVVAVPPNIVASDPGAPWDGVSADAARAQLVKILQSQAFKSAHVLSQMLSYVVDRTLEGRTDELKEYSLGVDVFGRGVSFDPRADTIVRVQARRLRFRLDEYYRTEGRRDSVMIEVPKGRYLVSFRPLPWGVANPPAPLKVTIKPTDAVPGRRGKTALLLGALAVMLAVAAWGTWRWWWLRPEAVSGSRAITRSGRVMFPDRYLMQFPGLATDGARVYFSQGGTDPSWGEKLVHAPVAGGPTADVSTPFRRQILHGISADGSKLLLQENTTKLGLDAQEGLLWALPLAGQTPFRLGDVLAHDAAWSSDGKRLVFANGQDLYVAGWDASNPRKLATTPGRAYWIRWAPDGSALRFTVADRNFRTSLWELRTDGSGLRRLFPGWRNGALPCCGEWSPDGRHFVFLAYENGRSDIWMRRESKGFLTTESGPVRLTSGPLNFASVIFGADGKRLLAVSPQARETVIRFHPGGRQIEPYAIEAVFPAFSRDRRWMAYTDGSSRTLWRSRPDGSEALQLTAPQLQAGWASWSPDGKQVAFIGHTAGGPYKLYVVASSGGAVRQLIPGDRQEVDPSWSPDGGSIMFGRPPDVLAEQGMPKAIYLLDLKSGKTTTLPGSDGMFAPVWTPDGRFVVTMPHKNWDRLMRFDFASRKWSELVPYDAAQLALSPDGEWVYFESQHNGHNVSRARLRDGRIERLLDFAAVTRGTLMTCGFGGVDLDGSPLLLCKVNASELYSLDLDLF